MQVAQIDVSRSAALAEMKLAMNRLGVSQRWVGREVGVTGARIQQILDGDPPGGALMFKLAALFGFDVGLFGEAYDGDVSAITLDERRGRPRSAKGEGESSRARDQHLRVARQRARTRRR